MRNLFIQKLIQAAEQDPSIYFIAGDVGFSVIEEFQKKFPTRYINAGIAEQNMMGVAAGLAMAGKKVYVYSIITFLTMRCFEQIRDDIGYQELPVKIIGVGGGLSYGPMGATHHALEDVALMRLIPGMTIVAPGSKKETESLAQQLINHDGPAYLRLSNNQELVDYPENSVITLGKAFEIISGSDYLLIASGNALDAAFSACKKLREQGIDIALASMHTIKPLDSDYLLSKQHQLKAIFTVEEHSIIGGLGEAVARVLAERFEKKVSFKAFAVQDFYFHVAGSRSYLNNQAGLSAEKMVPEMLKLIDLEHTNFFNLSVDSVKIKQHSDLKL